jgi:hypothetical protein
MVAFPVVTALVVAAFAAGFASGGCAVFEHTYEDFIDAAQQAGADPRLFRQHLQENAGWWP